MFKLSSDFAVRVGLTGTPVTFFVSGVKYSRLRGDATGVANRSPHRKPQQACRVLLHHSIELPVREAALKKSYDERTDELRREV